MRITQYGDDFNGFRFQQDLWHTPILEIYLLENYKPEAKYLRSQLIYYTNMPSVYPYEVVDYKDIEEAILNKNREVAYVQILPITMQNKQFMHYVVEASTGRIAGYSAPLFAFKGFTYGTRIKQRHLKDYTRFVD